MHTIHTISSEKYWHKFVKKKGVMVATYMIQKHVVKKYKKKSMKEFLIIIYIPKTSLIFCLKQRSNWTKKKVGVKIWSDVATDMWAHFQVESYLAYTQVSAIGHMHNEINRSNLSPCHYQSIHGTHIFAFIGPTHRPILVVNNPRRLNKKWKQKR